METDNGLALDELAAYLEISRSNLYRMHQCSAILVTLCFKCLAKLSIMAISDFLVIIAFCRERMVNEHMRAIRA